MIDKIKKLTNEMIVKQLPNTMYNKIQLKDIYNLAKYLDSSIFKKTGCTFARQYTTSLYMNGKKRSTSRVLYNNYIEPINGRNHFIKHKCKNTNCLNVNHMVLKRYKKSRKVKDDETNIILISFEPEDLIIHFD